VQVTGIVGRKISLEWTFAAGRHGTIVKSAGVDSMDEKTIIATLGIYKPEAKLIQTSTSKQRFKPNPREDLE